MSGLSSFIYTEKSFPRNQEWNNINKNILKSKYSVLYTLMNDAVVQSVGSTFQFNWRWLDLSLFLSELKLHEFDTVDWYRDIDKGKKDPKFNLDTIVQLYSDLPLFKKVYILQKSVIEILDAKLAGGLLDSALTDEEKGNFQKAIKSYEESIKLDPHNLYTLINYADLFVKLNGEVSKVEDLLNRVLILDPENARCLGYKALILEGYGKKQEACDCYEKAYQLDKTSSIRLRNYAMLLLSMKNYSKATILYEETIALDPKNGNIIGEYADLLHTMNLRAEAMDAFEKAISCKDLSDTVYNDYAVLLAIVGKETNNTNFLRKAKDVFAMITTPSYATTTNIKLIGTHDPTICAYCGEKSKYCCSKCHLVHYCSQECQKKHWSIHKKHAKHKA